MLASGHPGQMGTTRVWETTMQEVHVFSGITGTTRRFRLSAAPSLYLQMCFKQTGSNWSPTGGNQIRLCRLVFRGGIIIFDFFFPTLAATRSTFTRSYHVDALLWLSSSPFLFFFYDAAPLELRNNGCLFRDPITFSSPGTPLLQCLVHNCSLCSCSPNRHVSHTD